VVNALHLERKVVEHSKEARLRRAARPVAVQLLDSGAVRSRYFGRGRRCTHRHCARDAHHADQPEREM